MKARPNFRIVEGGSQIDVDMDELKKDYMDSTMSVDMILKKHNITRSKYYKLKPKIVEATGEPVKPSRFGGNPVFIDVGKYITQDPFSKKYRVAKYIDGMLKHFGRYKTFEEAKQVRDIMIEHEWDWKFYWENIRPKYHTGYISEDIFPDFERDFLDGMSIKDLQKKYGLSDYHYSNLATSVKHKYGLSRKPMVKA